jgi:hypothetical protein
MSLSLTISIQKVTMSVELSVPVAGNGGFAGRLCQAPPAVHKPS